MTDFYDPFGFRAADNRRDKWRQKAQAMFLPGIDPADLKPGMRVTISPNLRYEDNSYTDTIHTVIAVNQMHVQTRLDRGSVNDKPVLLMVNDHHFYDASGFEAPAAAQEVQP